LSEVYAGDAEEKGVGGDCARGFGCGGSAGDGGVFADPSAEDEDLTVGCSMSSAARVGLCVITVAARSAESARATARLVVPLPRLADPSDHRSALVDLSGPA
jgi:hypothetical protein